MEVIHQWFRKQVTSKPHTIAIKHHEQTISYEMLNQKANIVAYQLQMLGVKPDTLVAICLPRSAEQLIAVLGILMAGGAYVPFDPTQQMTRLNRLLDSNQIHFMITSGVYAKGFSAKMHVLCVEDLLAQPVEDKLFVTAAVEPNHLAYLIHTSGSTGVAKAVLLEQQNVTNYCKWFVNYTKIKPECLVDYSSNYIFDMAVTTMLLPLLFGCTMIICDDEVKQNPRAYLHHLKKNKIQMIKLTPSFLKMLLQELIEFPTQLPHLSILILGGENLSTSDCQAWLRHFPHHILYNEYGPSEATVGVMQHQITSKNVNQFVPNIPIGNLGLNVQAFLFDSNLDPVADGEMGELYLGGKCIARGYHLQPALTAEKFITHITPSQSVHRLYKTGDLCLKNKQGIYAYFGRIDRQIKIRGYRVELGEIELWLKQHPMIQDALIKLTEDQNGQQTLLAYCIVHPLDSLPNYHEMRGYLLNFLPHYMIPSAFISLDKFPLTHNGKLDETALPSPELIRKEPSSRALSDLEHQLIQIWSEELGLDYVGLHDNFYALGGHSLHAARIISAISQKMHQKITLSEFYQIETIAALADILKDRSNKSFEYSPPFSPTKNPGKKTKSLNKRRPLGDFQLLLWLSKTFEPRASQLNLVSRRRIQGQVDPIRLGHALQAILKRHEILSQRIASWYPAYLTQHASNIPFIETDLTHLPLEACDQVLLASIQALMQSSLWRKDHPLILLKIFYLDQNTVELQLCLPHLIADEISLNIIWRDFSHYYLLFCQQPLNTLPKQIEEIMPAKSFHDYIIQEQAHISAHFERDCEFWDTNLQNVALVSFPESSIVRNMKSRGLAYSTYYRLSASLLTALQKYCIQHHIGIEDILCVAVDAALRTITHAKHQIGVINMVKSTRQDRAYDETIGCFLRVDPIKIEFNPKHGSLLDLSKKTRQNSLNNAHFFQASTILKLAFLAAKNNQQKKNLVVNGLIRIYKRFLNQLLIDYEALELSAYFSSFKRDNRFIIYMNLWQNFVSSHANHAYLGLPNQTTPMVFHDLSCWDNLCDISFLRDEHHNQPYVVVSSNLLPEVRENIAETICRTLLSMVGEEKYPTPQILQEEREVI